MIGGQNDNGKINKEENQITKWNYIYDGKKGWKKDHLFEYKK